ncbi:hypothetical protein SAMN04487830_10284 [Pseudobutyrivibrio sp. OR37]|uniref:hypothetical protein n=1 Tax=Pseudobutyrivibrio sp. OR37 TaxID=1798186 RepID=UPI0008DF4D70|nr:hypothetical protein [Pseudobutyrivibrio sp. OR37]SFH57416.1 hypothetical protein SAMN04487830_10284 [Pseudobutyrivibrio sp. OR37]
MEGIGITNLNIGYNSGFTPKPLSSLGREIIANGGTEAQATKYTNRREAIHAGLVECATCASRKYQDGSDEQVSFKSAAHIAPQAAASRVRGHEQEHVNNAYDKAEKSGGKVLQASVSIHTAVCPECGKTYVAGGTTATKIAYPNEDNPYQKNRKEADGDLLAGMNFDAEV